MGNQSDENDDARIYSELAAILHCGLSNAELAATPMLLSRFGSPSRPATSEQLASTLTRLLMNDEQTTDPSADELSARTRFALALFRAPGSPWSGLETLTAAREAAGQQRIRPVGAAAVRGPNGHEDKLLRALSRRVAELPRPTGAALDLSPIYQPILESHLRLPFEARDSTRNLVDQLSKLEDITIYAGSDGPADVGPPLGSEIVGSLLHRELSAHPWFLRQAPDGSREELLYQLVDEAQRMYSTAFLGSIVRGLESQLPHPGEDTEGSLRSAIQEVVASVTTTGFVGRAITLLALSLRRAGRNVQILTTHHDSDIVDAQEWVWRHYPALQGVALAVVTDANVPPDPAIVPYVNLHERGSMVIGEADDASRLPLRQALLETSVVFVGSSLTGPGIIAELTESRAISRHPNYALLLPPTQLSASETRSARSLRLNLYAARFLHLGVVPAIAESPPDVPQTLREVALNVQLGAEYLPYSERLHNWWDSHRNAFSDDPSMRRKNQELWHEVLQSLRDGVEAAVALTSPAVSEERFSVEVWIRNPELPGRRLFPWASSDRLMSFEETNPSLTYTDSQVDATLREGHGLTTVLGPHSPWELCVSMPLALHARPRLSLVVGVVKILSDRDRGGLSGFVRLNRGQSWRALEQQVREQLQTLFS